jgi:hypothetical protein
MVNCTKILLDAGADASLCHFEVRVYSVIMEAVSKLHLVS